MKFEKLSGIPNKAKLLQKLEDSQSVGTMMTYKQSRSFCFNGK